MQTHAGGKRLPEIIHGKKPMPEMRQQICHAIQANSKAVGLTNRVPGTSVVLKFFGVRWRGPERRSTSFKRTRSIGPAFAHTSRVLGIAEGLFRLPHAIKT